MSSALFLRVCVHVCASSCTGVGVLVRTWDVHMIVQFISQTSSLRREELRGEQVHNAVYVHVY